MKDFVGMKKEKQVRSRDLFFKVMKIADETVSEKPFIVETQLLNEFEFDEDDDEDVVDLRAFNTTEKVIYMDFFDLPPQPKVIKNWIIQQGR